MNKWTDDDDGFVLGMFEEEREPVRKVSRRDVRTRHQRPTAEWTPCDVAVEFRERMEREFPFLLKRFPLGKNAVVLGTMRKRYETTPLVELALIELFLTDKSNTPTIKRDPGLAYRLWFATWNRNLDKARDMVDNAPQDALYAPEKSEEDAESGEEAGEAPAGLLVASDGRTFPRTIPGRKRLERWEEKLKTGV